MGTKTFFNKIAIDHSLGEELIREFVLHASGAPLPKSHMPRVFAIFLERIWRMINAQPEFEEISTQEQLELISSNSSPALALIVLNAENCSDGFEQARAGGGDMDEVSWNQNLQPLMDSGFRMKKLSMFDAAKMAAVELSQDDLNLYRTVMNHLGSMASTTWIYKLVLLLVMTQPRKHSNKSNAESKLHSNYRLILQRRINWLLSTETMSQQNFQMCLPSIDWCLGNLDNLATVMLKIMNSC